MKYIKIFFLNKKTSFTNDLASFKLVSHNSFNDGFLGNIIRRILLQDLF
jgi:hypothetical protein